MANIDPYTGQPMAWNPQQTGYNWQGTPSRLPAGSNPYTQIAQWAGSNPYGAPGWGQWSAPTDEVSKAYYSKNPQGAIGLFSRAAGGSPGGNLEAFMKQVAQQQYENYISQNLKPGGENLFYTDQLNDQLRQQGWAQWQSQNPYQRGENANVFMGAGRRS